MRARLLVDAALLAEILKFPEGVKITDARPATDTFRDAVEFIIDHPDIPANKDGETALPLAIMTITECRRRVESEIRVGDVKIKSELFG